MLTEQESARAVPVRSSGVYGARTPLEHPDGIHGRRPVIKDQFYKNSGVRLE